MLKDRSSEKPVPVKSTAMRIVFISVLCLVMMLVAGCSSPAATEVSAEGEPPGELVAQPFAPDAGTRFETPYYVIEVPESWVGETSFSYWHGYSLPNPGLGLGYSTNVSANDTRMARFSVTCFTDTWGVQGPFYAMSVGSTPLLEGNYVNVYAPRFDEEQNHLPDETEEYASFVSVKQEASEGEAPTLELPYYSFDLTAPEAAGWTITYNGAHRIEGDEGIGYSLDVSDRETGERLFYVVCATEEYGPDAGDKLALEVGAPSAWPQARVYVYQMPFGPDGRTPKVDLAAYARYVTVK